MRNAGGYIIAADPGSDTPVEECDTFTCFHCQRIVKVPAGCPPTDMGGFCGQCTNLICPKCVNKRTCTPWEKQMEESEARDAALRSYGMV